MLEEKAKWPDTHSIHVKSFDSILIPLFYPKKKPDQSPISILEARWLSCQKLGWQRQPRNQIYFWDRHRQMRTVYGSSGQVTASQIVHLKFSPYTPLGVKSYLLELLTRAQHTTISNNTSLPFGHFTKSKSPSKGPAFELCLYKSLIVALMLSMTLKSPWLTSYIIQG